MKTLTAIELVELSRMREYEKIYYFRLSYRKLLNKLVELYFI